MYMRVCVYLSLSMHVRWLFKNAPQPRFSSSSSRSTGVVGTLHWSPWWLHWYGVFWRKKIVSNWLTMTCRIFTPFCCVSVVGRLSFLVTLTLATITWQPINLTRFCALHLNYFFSLIRTVFSQDAFVSQQHGSSILAIVLKWEITK